MPASEKSALVYLSDVFHLPSGSCDSVHGYANPAVMRDNVDEFRTCFLQDRLIKFRVRGTKLEKMDGFQFGDISYLAIRKTLDPFSW